MNIPLKSRCPHCSAGVKVPEASLGKTIRCPGCGESFEAHSTRVVDQQSFETALSVAVATDSDSGLVASAGSGETLRDASQEPTISELGRFQLKQVLGQGAFGRVYRAYDPQLDRLVALKVPLFSTQDKKKIRRFLTEAKAAARLRHPNIVPTYDSGKADKRYYLATQFIAGETLSERIRSGSVSFRQAATWVRDLAEALAYAHSESIVHRDIKPHNIMLDEREKPQLMDFGLAKRTDDESELTTDGSLLGTPAYMAPEQAKGQHDQVGPRSDQYSLGVVLYELLTRKRPFEGEPYSVIHQVLNDEPPPPGKLVARLPPDLAAICQKAMSKNPADRYESCAQFAEDLNRWLQGRPIAARPISLYERTVRWCRREPLLAASISSALLLFLVAFGLAVASWRQQSRAASDLRTEQEKTRKEQRNTEQALVEARLRQQEAEEHQAEAVQARESLNTLVIDMQTAFGLTADDRNAPTEALVWYATAASLSESDLNRYRANLARVQFKARSLALPVAACRLAAGIPRISPGARYLLVNSEGLKIWARDTEEIIPVPGEDVTTAAWVDRSDRLAVAHQDGRITIHRPETWEVERTVKMSKAVRDLTAHPTGSFLVAWGAEAGDLWLVNLQQDSPPVHLPQAVPVAGVSLAKTQPRFALVGEDSLIQVYDAASGQPKALGQPLPAFQSTPPVFLQGDQVLVFTAGNSAAVIDVATGQTVRTYALGYPTLQAATSPREDQYALLTDYYQVSLFNADGTRIAALEHTNLLYDQSFSPDGKVILTVGSDRMAKLWDAATGRPLGRLPDHSYDIRCGQFLNQGTQFVTAQEDGLTRIWDYSLPADKLLAEGTRDELMFSVSSDGQYFVPGLWALSRSLEAVTVYESRTARVASPALTLTGTLNNSVFAPDDRLLVTLCSQEAHRGPADWSILDWAHWGGWLQFWDWKTGQELFPAFETPTEPIEAVFLDPETLIVACAGGEVFALKYSSRKLLWQVKEAETRRRGFSLKRFLNLDPTRRLLAISGFGPAVSLRETSTGNLKHTLSHGGELVTHFDLSPDGRFLATVGLAPHAQVWNVETGEKIGSPLEHADWLHQVRFDASGDYLLTAGRDHMARLWNWREGTLAIKPLEHRDEVFAAIFGTDGDWIVTCSRDRTIRLWDRHTGLPLSPPIEVGRNSYDALVVQGGARTLTGGSGLYSHDISVLSESPPRLPLDDVRLFGELASNRRVHESGSVLLSTGEWLARWSKYRKSPAFSHFLKHHPTPAETQSPGTKQN